MAGNLHLSITGDAGSALSALAKVQSAINSLSGKAVTVDVRVNGADKALGDLQALSGATDDATRATRAHSRASRVAARNVMEYGAASELAGEAVRNHGSAIDRTGHSMQRLGGDTARAGRAVNDFGAEVGHGASAASDLVSSAGSAGGSLGSMGRAASVAGRAASVAGMGFLYAAAGSGLLTAATGALGVASVGALGGIGLGLGVAAAGVTAFTVDSLKDMQGFKGAFEDIGRTAQGYAAWVTAPYGAALVGMANAAAASGPALSAPLRAAFTEIGEVATRNIPGMLGAAAQLSKGFQDITSASAPAFDAFFSNLPELTGAAIAPMEQVARTFSGVADRASSAGVPAFRALASSVGDLGSEIVKIGADNIGPALRGMASLTDGATSMAHELRPAIGPSMDAFVDLGNAVMNAVGNSAPGIAQFAATVSDNAFGIQRGLQGAIQGMTAMGGLTVAAAGASGPAVERWGGAIERLATGVENTASVASKAASAGGGWDNLISGVLKNAGPVGVAAEGIARGLGLLQPTAEGVASGFNSMASSAGHALGRGPGEFTGFTSQMRRAADGSLEANVPAGAAQQIQAIQNQIDAGGLTPSQVNRLGQAQRNLRDGIAPSNAFAGLPGGQPVGGANAGLPGPGADASIPSTSGWSGGVSHRGSAAPAPQQSKSIGSMVKDFFLGSLGNLAGGAGAGVISPAAPLSALSQGMGSVKTATDAASQSQRSFGSAVAGSMGQATAASHGAGQGMQQQMQSATRGAQTAQQQIPAAVSGMAQAIPQAISQGAAGAAPAVSSAVGRMVSRVSDVAPQASSAGQGVGVAITGGASGGVTTTQERTITIIRKWVKKIIDVAADGLDAHSPSRVFVGLGQGIADGMAIGVAANSGAAVAATERMATATATAGQAALNRTQTQLGTQAQLASGPARSSAALPQLPQAALTQAQAYARNLGVAAAGHVAATTSAEAHRAAVERLGLSETSTGQKMQARIEANQARAELAQAKRMERRDAARWRAEHGIGPASATPEGISQDAAAYRAQQEGRLADRSPTKNFKPPAPSTAGWGQFAKDAAQGFLFGSADFGSMFRRDGARAGQALGQGMSQGIRGSQANPVQSAIQMAADMTERTKRFLGIRSPSRVFADIGAEVGAGMAGGLGSAVSGASDGVRGIASDRGLQVGYSWGRSVVTGADAVLKKADFQAAGFPQIESAQAKAALGALGLLGPAGSGAQIWKAPAVTLGGGGTAPGRPPAKFDITLIIDGNPVRTIATQVVEESFDELAGSITRQVG